MKLLSKNQEQASILQHKEEEIQIKDAEIERLK